MMIEKQTAAQGRAAVQRNDPVGEISRENYTRERTSKQEGLEREAWKLIEQAIKIALDSEDPRKRRANWRVAFALFEKICATTKAPKTA